MDQAESLVTELFTLYHQSKDRQDFVSASLNRLLLGDEYTAEIAWECIDRVYDQEDIGKEN